MDRFQLTFYAETRVPCPVQHSLSMLLLNVVRDVLLPCACDETRYVWRAPFTTCTLQYPRSLVERVLAFQGLRSIGMRTKIHCYAAA